MTDLPTWMLIIELGMGITISGYDSHKACIEARDAISPAQESNQLIIVVRPRAYCIPEPKR